MPLIYQTFIHRNDLRCNPSVLYVFGDNVERRGYRGQAKDMRGEPNAVGIATKWAPSRDPSAYFYDHQMEKVLNIWNQDFQRLMGHAKSGTIIVWPADGIGTGLSDLPNKAPQLWKKLEQGCLCLEQGIF